MDASTYATICTSSPGEIALYLRQLLFKLPEETISKGLLDATENGSVPVSVFPIWLTVTKSPAIIVDTLLQSNSSRVRQSAIKQIGKRIQSSDWRETWECLGATKGILDLLAKLPVVEVKKLLHAISRSSKGRRDEEKQEQVTELLQCLFSSIYPDPPYKNSDQRPLQNIYGMLAPACSSEFVQALLLEHGNPLFQFCSRLDLLRFDYTVLRKMALESLSTKNTVAFRVNRMLPDLLQRAPSRSSVEPGWSDSMYFSVIYLRELAARRDPTFDTTIFLPQLVEPLIRRVQLKKIDRIQIREIMDLTISYLQAHPKAINSLTADRRNFVACVLRCWSKQPEMFEDQLVGTLKVFQDRGKVSGQGRIGLYKEICRFVHHTQRYQLLRLLILHDQSLGADLDSEESLRTLQAAIQATEPVTMWNCDVFKEQKRAHAIALMQRLISVYPKADFLVPNKWSSTILQLTAGPKTTLADPSFLLTFLERGEQGALARAQSAVTERKNKAVASREQSDRAFFAKSALYWAIASGSIPLYGETVVWARRYVRDALTCKVLYSRNVVNTSEGVDLLSCISPDSVKGKSAAEIRSRVSEANKVLLNFIDTYLEAEKEPQFHKYDWDGPLSLPKEVVNARLKGAAALQRSHKLSSSQLYDTLWGETLAMLLEMEGQEAEALRVVSSIINTIPSSSLISLTGVALEKLMSMPSDATNAAALEHATNGLLILAVSSDRPQQASDLILRAILDRPDASSWHRKILNRGLLKRLPAANAQALLGSFAKSICLKLEAQSKLTPSRAAQRSKRNSIQSFKSTQSSTPTVKVTTVKYLAQLLNEAEFVPQLFAVEVLSTLLQNASHIDIRVAVVESLLAMLAACTGNESTPLASRLLFALEQTIPMASGLNERRPIQEKDWLEAQTSGTLLEIYEEGSMKTLPPLLRLLVTWKPSEPKWRRHVVERILLPIIENSRLNNMRWMQMFLSNYGIALTATDLPSLPVKPMLLYQLVSKNASLIPASVLDLFQQFILVNIQPSAEITAVTEKVNSDGVLLASNEGKHWLSLFGQGKTFYELGAPSMGIANMLAKKWRSSEIADGITLPQVQRMVLQQIHAFIQLCDDTFHGLNSLIWELCPPTETTKGGKQAWLANCKPVLQQIISGIESLRTPAWQQNLHREPSVLPPTFLYRLWLLSYPTLAPATTDDSEKCKTFAEELADMARELIDRGAPYNEDLEQLASASCKSLPSYGVGVACHLGTLRSTSPSTKSWDLMCVKLAGDLLKDAPLPVDEDAEKVKKLLASWRASGYEEARMHGLRLVRELRQRASKEGKRISLRA